MRGQDLREYVRANGPLEVTRALLEMLELPKENHDRLVPEDFSVRELWEGLVGPCRSTLPSADFSPFDVLEDVGGVREAEARVSLFQIITGELVTRKMIEGYERRPYIYPELTEEIEEKRKKFTVPGLEGIPEPEEIKIGAPYPRKQFASEKYVTGEQTKKGLIVSIDEDLVLEDQTGQLFAQAANVGEIMALDREERTLKAVTDYNTSPYVFQPAGTGEALFRTSVGTNSSRINALTAALVDWTDIDAAMALFAAFKKNMDQTGKLLIPPQSMTLLTAFALASTAHRIVNATEVQYRDETSGTGPSVKATNPYAGRLRHLSSNLVDSLRGPAYWYLGDFKKQFKTYYKWLRRMLSRYRSGEAYWNADVLAEWKGAEYYAIAATDDCWVVKSTGAG